MNKRAAFDIKTAFDGINFIFLAKLCQKISESYSVRIWFVKFQVLWNKKSTFSINGLKFFLVKFYLIRYLNFVIILYFIIFNFIVSLSSILN